MGWDQKYPTACKKQLLSWNSEENTYTVWKVISSNRRCQNVPLSITGKLVIHHKEKSPKLITKLFVIKQGLFSVWSITNVSVTIRRPKHSVVNWGWLRLLGSPVERAVVMEQGVAGSNPARYNFLINLFFASNLKGGYFIKNTNNCYFPYTR